MYVVTQAPLNSAHVVTAGCLSLYQATLFARQTPTPPPPPKKVHGSRPSFPDPSHGWVKGKPAARLGEHTKHARHTWDELQHDT